MYKFLLTFRYLRRKLIPVFALLAVTLCTAMVVIVLSIMGGFLDLVRSAGRTLIGDVSLHTGLSGFPHYDGLMKEIRQLPEAEGATPIIVAYGLVKLPGDSIRPVEVLGIRGEGQDAVTDYRKTLYWTPKRFDEKKQVKDYYGDVDPIRTAIELKVPWKGMTDLTAAVPGIEISPYNRRLPDGTYMHGPTVLGEPLTLTVLPITAKGGLLEPSTERIVPVNEFHSGLFEVDDKRVFIPFDVAQRMMHMDASDKVELDEDGAPVLDENGKPKVIDTIPARCTAIQVKAAPGVSADALRAAVERVYVRYAADKAGLPSIPFMTIETWEKRQEKIISVVEKEKGLMAFLFGIISMVAVVTIGVIFYMIVLEKTRDIGILRAVGASAWGVASIFLSFGAVIGALGASVGTVIAYLVVTYINEIHDWMGEHFGVVIWDKSVYFFDRIPSRVDWLEIAVIVAVAIVASVMGSAIPAIKAARVDPIQSLRYE